MGMVSWTIMVEDIEKYAMGVRIMPTMSDTKPNFIRVFNPTPSKPGPFSNDLNGMYYMCVYRLYVISVLRRTPQRALKATVYSGPSTGHGRTRSSHGMTSPGWSPETS